MRSSHLSVNVIYNIIGMIAPLAVSILTMPLYLRVIGEARFGVISLIWLIFGYFGLFDFGLSRATTNRLSQLQESDTEQRRDIFYTALLTNLCLGVIAAAAFYVSMLLLLSHGFASFGLMQEIPPALPWLSAFVPLALIGGVFVGTLEADERFLTLNLQQIVGSILLQCLPLAAVLVFGANIEVAVIGALVARLASVIWNAVAALQSMNHAGRPTVHVSLIWSLLKYGGGVTVSGVVSPMLVAADQLLIASLLGPQALTHYVVPFNLAMKALIIPGALSRALFPRLSSLGREAAAALTERAVVRLAGLTSLVCVPAILLSNVGLTIWLGEKFAVAAAPVAQTLFVGAWINGLAAMPGTLLYGSGRPDIVARFHVMELLPFIAILWLLVNTFGLQGAAVAWCLRVLVDAVLLFWASGGGIRYLPALLPAGFFVVVAWLVATFLYPGPQFAVPFAVMFEGGIATWLVSSNNIRKLMQPLALAIPFRRRP